MSTDAIKATDAAVSERDIQTAILKEFGNRDELRIWRAAVGVGRPVNSNRLVQFGVIGQCDISGIICLPDHKGRRLEIEVKKPGGRLSERQKLFGAMISRMGGVWIVATSTDDVYQGLELEGITLPRMSPC